MKQIPTQTDGLTSLAAADFNQIPLETQTIITSSGQTLDGNFTNQASRAIIDLGMNAGFYTDSGTANNIILSNSNNPSPTSLRDGIEITFKAAASNTGATTLNLSGLGAKTVKSVINEDLVSGQIISGIFYKAIYIASSDTFQIYPIMFNSGATTGSQTFGATASRSAYTCYWFINNSGLLEQFILGLVPVNGATQTIELAKTYQNANSYIVNINETGIISLTDLTEQAGRVDGKNIRIGAIFSSTGAQFNDIYAPAIRTIGFI